MKTLVTDLVWIWNLAWFRILSLLSSRVLNRFEGCLYKIIPRQKYISSPHDLKIVIEAEFEVPWRTVGGYLLFWANNKGRYQHDPSRQPKDMIPFTFRVYNPVFARKIAINVKYESDSGLIKTTSLQYENVRPGWEDYTVFLKGGNDE